MAKKVKSKEFIPNQKSNQQSYNTKAKISAKSSRAMNRRSQ